MRRSVAFSGACIQRVRFWIAGGVGISPFFTWLDDPQANSLARVSSFYFHTPGRGFPSLAELAARASARSLELICIDADADSPAFTDALTTIFPESAAKRVDIDFCGLAGLLTAVSAQLLIHGVAASQIRHELFEFR